MEDCQCSIEAARATLLIYRTTACEEAQHEPVYIPLVDTDEDDEAGFADVGFGGGFGGPSDIQPKERVRRTYSNRTNEGAGEHLPKRRKVPSLMLKLRRLFVHFRDKLFAPLYRTSAWQFWEGLGYDE